MSLLSALDDPRRGYSAAVAYSANLGDGVPNDPSYWEFFREQAAGKVAVVVWNGNQHQDAFLLRPTPPFRVFHQAVTEEQAASDGVWIPSSLLREYWDGTFSEFSTLVSNLKERSKVVVVGTPQPKPLEFVLGALARDPYFVDRARDLNLPIQASSITSGATRLAMWHVIQDEMRRRTLDVGAIFVAVPSVAADSRGYLASKFSNPDVTHANAEFGTLMWETVQQALAGGL